MARVFNGSTQYLGRDGSFAITSYPFTLSAWIYLDNVTANHAILGFNSTTQAINSTCLIYALGGVAGDPVAAYVAEGATEQRVDSTTGFSANTWHHVCGVFASATSRTIYLDNGGSASGSTSITPTFANVNRVNIGSWYSDVSNAQLLFLAGRVAYASVHAAALTADEIADLGRKLNGVPCGVHPIRIRPESLVACWPLGGFHGDDDRDIFGQYDLTASGGPTFDESPPVVYPTGGIITDLGQVSGGGGGGGGGIVSRIMQQHGVVLGA